MVLVMCKDNTLKKCIVIFQNDTSFNILKPILHYAFGLRFGNVCEHKRERDARETQMARVFKQRIV